MKKIQKKKVLFILKQREKGEIINDYSNDLDYSDSLGYSSGQLLTTGLLNSASYVSEMIDETFGFSSKLVVVTDNNDIDREVSLYSPTHVVIEALWVIPEKIQILKNLHPNVKWIIRVHSEIPFIASEGVSFNWLYNYLKIDGVSIAVNSRRMEKDMEFYFNLFNELPLQSARERVIYLPNYYPTIFNTREINKNKQHVDVACFGAIRPLKNHLIQAVAAVMFAERIGKKLRFHINVTRVEQRGEAILKNLESLFDAIASKGHVLVKHDWYDKETFLQICRQMDIGMQVSLSETFNLVTADLISQGVPMVTSEEIDWIGGDSFASTTDTQDIANTLLKVYNNSDDNARQNRRFLRRFSRRAEKIWIEYLSE